MPYFVGFVSQKGGVGKSSLARTFAAEMARNELSTLLCDMDTQQKTARNWVQRREASGIEPEVEAAVIETPAAAKRTADRYDVVVMDGLPHSSSHTEDIAKIADMVVLPSGQSLDDLEPTVELAHSLVTRGIPVNRIAIVLCRTSSDVEVAGAREYLAATDYYVCAGHVPFKTGYSAAGDVGRGLTEAAYPSLREHADTVIQALIDRLSTITEEN